MSSKTNRTSRTRNAHPAVALVARLYDKTAEIRKHGVSWLPDLWGEDFTPGSTVWRLEFQFRREALTEFHFRTVDEVVASGTLPVFGSMSASRSAVAGRTLS